MEEALRSHAGLGELMRAAAGELEQARSELAQERKKTALLEGAIKTQQAQILSLSCNNEEIAKRLNAELRLPAWFGAGKEKEEEVVVEEEVVADRVEERSAVALTDAILDMVRSLCRGTTTHAMAEALEACAAAVAPEAGAIHVDLEGDSEGEGLSLGPSAGALVVDGASGESTQILERVAAMAGEIQVVQERQSAIDERRRRAELSMRLLLADGPARVGRVLEEARRVLAETGSDAEMHIAVVDADGDTSATIPIPPASVADCAETSALAVALGEFCPASEARSAGQIDADAVHELRKYDSAHYLPPSTLDKSRVWDFDVLELSDDEALGVCAEVFHRLGLQDRFGIAKVTLFRFLRRCRDEHTAKSGFHGFRRAVQSLQAASVMLGEADLSAYISEQDQLALLLACLCVDMGDDTRGDPAADPADLMRLPFRERPRYRACAQAIALLGDAGCSPLAGLEDDDARQVLNATLQMMQACNMGSHFEIVAAFSGVALDGSFRRTRDVDRSLLLAVLAKSCYYSFVSRPFEIAREWGGRMCAELFAQCDQSRDSVVTIIDRTSVVVPQLQIGFVRVMTPLYLELARLAPELEFLGENAQLLLASWGRTLDQEREQILRPGKARPPSALSLRDSDDSMIEPGVLDLDHDADTIMDPWQEPPRAARSPGRSRKGRRSLSPIKRPKLRVDSAAIAYGTPVPKSRASKSRAGVRLRPLGGV